VIPRLALALEQDDGAAAREMIRGRGACYAGADDEEITFAYRHDPFSL
jgi:hypothetical protein